MLQECLLHYHVDSCLNDVGMLASLMPKFLPQCCMHAYFITGWITTSMLYASVSHSLLDFACMLHAQFMPQCCGHACLINVFIPMLRSSWLIIASVPTSMLRTCLPPYHLNSCLNFGCMLASLSTEFLPEYCVHACLFIDSIPAWNLHAYLPHYSINSWMHFACMFA